MEVLTQSNTSYNGTIYHITTTHQARTIFERDPNSTYQYVERKPEPVRTQQTNDFSRFKDETARLQSFNHQWPIDCPVDKHELARAGLFFTGPGDRVQCPWCEGGLYNWEEGDTAFGEHAKHFPSCPFLMSRSGSFVDSTTNSTAAMGVRSPRSSSSETRCPSTPNICSAETRSQSTPKTSSAETRSHSTTEGDDWTKRPCVVAILDLGYSTHDVKTAIYNLATKGISESELTTDLIMDDIFTKEVTPIDEQPSFVSTPTQNEEYTKANDENTCQVHTTKTTCSKTPSKPRVDAGELIGEISRLKQENETLKSNMTCKICLDARVGELFLPCRHLVCCVDCSTAVHECPLCRKRIEGTIKTFL